MARRALGPAGLAVVQAVDAAVDSDMLVACSGGPDSLALAAAAAVVGQRRSRTVRAVVVDHGLQPGSSQVAADTCDQLMDRLHVPATVVAVHVEPQAGPEADARQARAVLGWQPRFADVDTIVAHAWVSEQKRVG